MKKLTALLLLLPTLALAGPPDFFARREATESQALTRSAPSTATEGVGLNEAVAVMVALDAGSGKTLTAGNLDAWLYDKWDGTNFAWSKFPSRNLPIPAGCAGQRYCVIEALTVDGPRYAQRILFATNGVTVSSGTTVTVNTLVTVSLKSSSR